MRNFNPFEGSIHTFLERSWCQQLETNGLGWPVQLSSKLSLQITRRSIKSTIHGHALRLKTLGPPCWQIWERFGGFLWILTLFIHSFLLFHFPMLVPQLYPRCIASRRERQRESDVDQTGYKWTQISSPTTSL